MQLWRLVDNTLRKHKARPAAFSIRDINNRWHIMSCLWEARDTTSMRPWSCVLTEQIDTNSNWQWDLDTVQENKCYNTNITNQRLRKRTEGETEDGMRRKAEKQHGGSHLPEKHSCSLSMCVYFPKMLPVVIFQYQILLAWEILWALQQTAGVLSSLVTERERGLQPHTGLLSGHTGVI